MKQHFDRYFELFPLLAIILILVASEYRQHQKTFDHPVVDYGFPSLEVQVPRVILR